MAFNMKRFSHNFRSARQESGYSVRELSIRTKIPERLIKAWEKEPPDPTLAPYLYYLDRAAEVMGISAYKLLEGCLTGFMPEYR